MSSIFTCTRRIQFCAGHRVMGHESKCRHLHGHNYVVHITAAPKRPTIEELEALQTNEQGLDPQGRVIDFSVLKEQYGTWIDKTWDHGFILHMDDRPAQLAMHAFEDQESPYSPDGKLHFMQKVFFLPYNPTAENIARYLFELQRYLELPGIEIIHVEVEETENCRASYGINLCDLR